MGEITTVRRFIFERFNTTISCWKNSLVETNDNCFQRSSVELLVAPVSYGRNYHYWEAFWKHTKYVSWVDASQSVQCSTNSRVLTQRSILKPRKPVEWIQVWAIGRNLPNDALKPSSYSALSSCLCWSGNFSGADYFSSSVDNKQCACKIDDSLIRKTFSEQKQTTNQSPVPLQSEGSRCNPSWIRKPQKDLVANSKVCGSTKNNSLGASVGSEKALFLFQRLLELESSDAPFKDSMLSYIDLLQKEFGRFHVTEHSRTLDFDLGVTNSQCTCFGCMTQPLQIIGSTAQEGNNYALQLFSV